MSTSSNERESVFESYVQVAFLFLFGIVAIILTPLLILAFISWVGYRQLVDPVRESGGPIE